MLNNSKEYKFLLEKSNAGVASIYYIIGPNVTEFSFSFAYFRGCVRYLRNLDNTSFQNTMTQ